MSYNPSLLPAQDSYEKHPKPSAAHGQFSSPSDLTTEDAPAPKAEAKPAKPEHAPKAPRAPKPSATK